MSFHETIINRPAIAAAERDLALVARLAASIRAWFARLDREAEHRRAIRELESQPDYILRDIGLDRYSIRRRVRGLTDDD